MDLIARTVSSADINDPNMADDAKKDAMMDAHTKTFKMSRDRKELGMLSPELYDYYQGLLTDKQREYFEDYYFENYTIQEIADNNEVSKKTYTITIS